MDDALGMILMIMCGALMPFALFGIVWFFKWLNAYMKTRKGFVKARFILSTFRTKEMFIKPSEGMIERKKIGGDKRQYPYNNKNGFLTWEGNTPVATYNEEMAQQLNMSAIEQSGEGLSPKRISDLMFRAFNLGKMSQMKEDNMMKFLIFIAAGCAGIAAVLGIMNLMNLGSLSQQITQTIANYAPALSQSAQQTASNTIGR